MAAAFFFKCRLVVFVALAILATDKFFHKAHLLVVVEGEDVAEKALGEMD